MSIAANVEECYLNGTGGICPITACSKSLINGQCGGAKNGMCEVDKGHGMRMGTNLPKIGKTEINWIT